jgi:hypothetical protein
VKSQDGASHDCVENAGRGILFRLGIPPQAQRAQACLTNAVAGKVVHGAVTPIAQPFRGSCGTAATLDDLAACAEGLARGAFYQSLAGFDVLTFDCDLTDNGAADLACESADLTDFRDVFAEALDRHMGMPVAQLGPVSPSYSPSAATFLGLYV